MKRKILSIISGLLLILSSLQAQTYQIRAVNKGDGLIGVEMRITTGTPPTTANQVTDIVFGLKWQSSYSVDLTVITGANSAAYNIQKSDVRKSKNGIDYQAFFAANTAYFFPSSWILNSWVEIMNISNTKTGTGVGAFFICEAGFDITTDPNIGVDLVDYTPVINGTAVDVILPVNLTKFSASPQKNSIKVNWSTQNEINSKGFELQRSPVSVTNFKKIAWVDSKGASSNSNDYVFEDNDVTANVRYYYRLKQVDMDAHYKYSEVKSAILTDHIETIQIQPNPAYKILQVIFDNKVRYGQITLSVIDAKGAVLVKRDDYMDAGKIIDLDLSALGNGQYFLVITEGETILYSKSFQKR